MNTAVKRTNRRLQLIKVATRPIREETETGVGWDSGLTAYCGRLFISDIGSTLIASR